MSTKKKIVSNTLYQLLAKIISTLSTLVISILITRILGAKTWGEYSIVIAYLTFFYIFTEFGLNSVAARDFSVLKNVGINEFYNFFLVRFFHTLLIVIIGVVFLQFLNYPYHIKLAIYFSQIGVFFFSLSSAYNSLFQSKLLYKYLFFTTLGSSLLNLFLFFTLLNYFNRNIVYLFVPMIIADITRFVLALYFSHSILLSEKFVLSLQKMRHFFISALPLGIALLFNTLMTQIDKIMLSVMVDPIYVGYYSLSYKLFDVLLVLPTFFMNAAFTVFVQRYKQRNSYGRELSLSILCLTIVSVLITLISLLTGWFLIPLIWGADMRFATTSFNILITGTILFYISSPISWAFVVENKQKYLIYFYLSGFIVNFLLNMFFIRVYGYIGAAVTTIITEALILLLLEIYRKKVLKVRYDFDYRKIRYEVLSILNFVKLR